MKTQTHMRLASAAAGDDVTLTRYVRVDRAHTTPRKLQPRIPGLAAPFIEQGRTKFPTRVIAPSDMSTLLVSGHSNVKIGRDVRKGKLRGWWIYTLSLEERKTCPSSCDHWQSCYGNNMPFAKRVDHTTPDFLLKLENEIIHLCHQRRKTGVLIRLHALGDFYSQAYVDFWRRMLEMHKNLAIYGYTARSWYGDPIGRAVYRLRLVWGRRFMVRTSNSGEVTMSTAGIASVEQRPAGAFVCPAQLGLPRCCATCAACWSTTKNVAFLDH